MSKELNDLFDYDYKIYQDTEFFKFSLDSVLLSEFVELKASNKKILDMCTGNGAVAMILSKIYGDKINITGVELQKEIFALAKESVEYNKINNITLVNDDIVNYANTSKEEFDLVVCNPPYFKTSNVEIINDNEIKAIARHEIKLDLDGVIYSASKCVKNKGMFYLVHRPERLADIILTMNKYKFGVKRVQAVYDHVGAKCSLILVEAMYNGENYVKITEPIYLNEKRSYKGIFRGE